MANRGLPIFPALGLSCALLAGCARRPPAGPLTWSTMDSFERQGRLTAMPSCDARVLLYNHGQIEFLERRPRGDDAPARADTAAPGRLRPGAPIPVAYIHGIGGTMGDFAPQILADGLERVTIAVNLPGTGRSTSTGGRYTIQSFAESLHELLVHRMGFPKVDLVCHSLGGQVCIAFALEYPASVASLTLVDAAGSYDQGEFVRRMAKRFGRINMGTVTVPNHPAITVFTDGNQSIINRLLGEDPLIIAALNSFSQSYRGRIRNLAVPVLLIWGENDPVFPLQYGFFLQSNIRDIRMKVVPEAGHVPQLSHADLVIRWLHEFHGSLRAPAPGPGPNPGVP